MAGRKGGSRANEGKARHGGGRPSAPAGKRPGHGAGKPQGKPHGKPQSQRPGHGPGKPQGKRAQPPRREERPHAAPEKHPTRPVPVRAEAPTQPRRRERPLPVPEGPHRAGFAVLMGRPNVGKSTLLNRLVGEHVAAVSPRPQTTRTRILGVVNRPNTQLCLVDVPGVHRARGSLNRAMVDAAMTALGEVDVVLYLAEAGWPMKVEDPTQIDPVGPFHRELLADVAKANRPVVLVLTKIDLIPKHLLLPLMDAWQKAFAFKEIYPLSALTGDNVEGLVLAVRSYLPEGPPLFPPDTITDQHERTLCSELIREQVFLQTKEEVPYGTAVVIEEFDESSRPVDDEGEASVVPSLGVDPELSSAEDMSDEVPEEEEEEAAPAMAEGGFVEVTVDESGEDVDEVDFDDAEEEGPAEAEATEAQPEPPAALGPGLVRIHASIIVERPSHKGIVIGHRGERLRQIGTQARLQIERLLGCRVWLGLHVRVMPGWTEKQALLAEMGLSGR